MAQTRMGWVPSDRQIEAFRAKAREGLNPLDPIDAQEMLVAAWEAEYRCPTCKGGGWMDGGELRDAVVDMVKWNREQGHPPMGKIAVVGAHCDVCGGSGWDPDITEWLCFPLDNPDHPGLPVGEGMVFDCWFWTTHTDRCGWYPKRERLT